MEAGDENEGDVHHVGAWSIPRIRDAHLVLVGPNFSGCHSFRYGPLRGIKHFELADSCRCSDCCGPVRTEPGRTVRFWCVNPCQNYMDKRFKIGLSILWQMWHKPKIYPNRPVTYFTINTRSSKCCESYQNDVMLYYTVRYSASFTSGPIQWTTPLNVKCDFLTKWFNLSRDMKNNSVRS